MSQLEPGMASSAHKTLADEVISNNDVDNEEVEVEETTTDITISVAERTKMKTPELKSLIAQFIKEELESTESEIQVPGIASYSFETLAANVTKKAQDLLMVANKKDFANTRIGKNQLEIFVRM